MTDTRRFQSREEFVDWIDSEIKWWEWLQREPKLQKGRQYREVAVKLLIQAANRGRDKRGGDVRHFLEDHFVSQRRPYSGGPTGKALLALDSSDHSDAVEACGVFLGAGSQNVSDMYQAIAPALRVVLLRHGIADTKPAIEALEQAAKALNADFEMKHAETTQRLAECGEAIKHIEETRVRLEEEFKEQCLRHKEALDGIRKKFQDEMALKAPVEYWSARRRTYWWASAAWGGVSVVMFAICVCLFDLLFVGVLPLTDRVVTGLERLKTAGGVMHLSEASASDTRAWLMAITS